MPLELPVEFKNSSMYLCDMWLLSYNEMTNSKLCYKYCKDYSCVKSRGNRSVWIELKTNTNLAHCFYSFLMSRKFYIGFSRWTATVFENYTNIYRFDWSEELKKYILSVLNIHYIKNFFKNRGIIDYKTYIGYVLFRRFKWQSSHMNTMNARIGGPGVTAASIIPTLHIHATSHSHIATARSIIASIPPWTTIKI